MKLYNLHLKTIFSFFESTITVDDAIKKAKENDIDYIVFTEKNHFFSLGEANKKCLENGIKPIFGLETSLFVNEVPYKFVLFAKNKEAFITLKKISYRLLNNEKITLKEILSFDDIFIIENPNHSYYKSTNNIIKNKSYYVGISLEEINNDNLNLNEEVNYLIFNNFITLDIEDYSIISLLKKMNNDEEKIQLDPGLFFQFDPKNKLVKKLVLKTNEFIKDLFFSFEKQKYELLKFKNDQNLSSKDYLRYLIWKNINGNEDFINLFKNEEYRSRLKKEFEIITSLEFEDYFLIIQDWINWAKNNNIAIGPGRGSSAGSLISYILGITEIDPIKYNLIFERFLNPKRISMPDIDVDVQDDRRYEIINYLVNKYGEDKVSNIITFSTLGKKSAIRDVLRAYEVSPTQINRVSKLISSDETSLSEEAKKNSAFMYELMQVNKNDEEFAEQIINQTSKISGFYRQIGTHAAGIIISDKPLIESIPSFKNDEEFEQTQLSMEYLEYFGLIKMDILGLKTLSTIKQIEENIKSNLNIVIDWKKIDYNDQKTFELLSSGNTAGIFQVESPIMIRALRNIKINSFNDISAVISLNRPGPMAYVTNYGKRKFKQEEIPSISKEYDEIVKDTYGIIIYQEQIMEIAQKIASMTFEEADVLRKVISKKQSNEMNEIRNNFIARALKNNYSLQTSSRIFDNIEKFADYGFNKSHAVAYSMLTFKMAYLKANYPLQFYASCITSANGAQATISKYVNEARGMKIQIISPEINLSNDVATIKDKSIILPFSLIKGVGPEIIKLIIENRKQNDKYINFLHCILCLKNIKSVGKATLELLIKSNCFRNFKLSQSTMLAEIDNNSNSMIFISQNLAKTSNEILNKLIDNNPKNYLDDDEKVLEKNEIDLLGQMYNFSSTKNYEVNGNRLIDTRINNEYVMVVQCINVVLGNDKRGKAYQRIDLQDSTQKVVAFMFKINTELNELKNKLLKIKFIRKDDNKILLLDWKVIK